MAATELALWSGRVAGTLAGLLLLYAAFFLYPDERRQLQSTLEGWWIRLDDARRSALDRQPLLIQRLAATTRRGFDRLFGEPLSKRFFVISGLLSMLSFALAMSTFGDYGWAVPSGLLIFGLATGWAVMQFGAVSDRMSQEWREQMDDRMIRLRRLAMDTPDPPARSPFDSDLDSLLPPSLVAEYRLRQSAVSLFAAKPERTWSDDLMEQMPTYVVVVLTTSSTGLVLAGAQERGVGTMTFLLAILSAFACDVVSILVTMALLERLSGTRTVVGAAGWLVVDAAVAAAMLVLPLALFLFAVDRDGPLGTYLVFLASANISTALPSAAYVLIALGLLLHRLLWPVFLRPFYNLVHAERLGHPKTLGAAGLALLLLCWPQVFAPFEPVVEAMLGVIDN